MKEKNFQKKSRVFRAREILRPDFESLLKLKESVQISFYRLNKLQKFGLFIYIIFSIYRGIVFNPLFFIGVFLPPFYLFLLQQPRVKGFIRMRQRDTRVRLKHYYEDFYYVWVFVNISFVFLAICALAMYCFDFVKNFLVSFGVPGDMICLDQFKNYSFFYFLFVIGLNWLTNLYIILFKNTRTFFKSLAAQDITFGAGIAGYFGLQSFVNLSGPEVNPTIQYYYHSYDFFGRGFHFHTSGHLEQSNYVKGALGSRYNPRMFLDQDNYVDKKRFLGFVWANRFEIGGALNESEKAKFPSWIKWVPEADVRLNDQTTLKDSNGVAIGRMVYDKENRVVPQFQSGVEVEPLYRPTNSTTEFEEERIPVISPVASQESSTSSITSVGEVIVPSSKS